MLILRGAPALSAFRHGKLLEQLSQKVPAVTGLYAEFAHFADVDGELTADQQQVLGRLLKYGPSVPVQSRPVACSGGPALGHHLALGQQGQ